MSNVMFRSNALGPSRSRISVLPPSKSRTVLSSISSPVAGSALTRRLVDTSFGTLLGEFRVTLSGVERGGPDYADRCTSFTADEQHPEANMVRIESLKDVLASVAETLGDTWLGSLRDAYSTYPEAFDLHNERYLLSSDPELDARDYAYRILSVIWFLREQSRPTANKTFLMRGDGESLKHAFKKVTMASTPHYILDVSDLGFIYVVKRGSGQRIHSPSYFIPYTPDNKRLRWHMREAARAQRSGWQRRLYDSGVTVAKPTAEPTLSREEVLAALAHGASDTLSKLFTELDIEFEQEGGLPSRLALGKRNYHNLERMLEGGANVSEAVGNIGESVRSLPARCSTLVKKLLTSGKVSSTLLVTCIITGACHEIIRSAGSLGAGAVRKVIKGVINAILPAKFTKKQVEFEQEGNIDGDSVASLTVSVLRCFTGASKLKCLFARTKWGGWNWDDVANDIELAQKTGTLSTCKTFETLKSQVMLFGVLVNAVRRMFGRQAVPFHSVFRDRYTHVKETISKLYPGCAAGTLSINEPERGDNVRECLGALDCVLKIQNSSRCLDPKVKAEVETHARYLREILRFYSVSGSAPQKKRVQPVAVVMAGPPGIGKSLLLPVIGKAVLMTGLPPEQRGRYSDLSDSELIFQRSSSEFADGETGQPVYATDDIFAEKETGGKETDASYFLRVCNGWHFPLNMANVELKGKKYAHPYVVMSTTNMSNLSDVTDNIRHTEAVARRMNFCFELSVSPAYAVGGSKCICFINPDGLMELDADKYSTLVREYTERGDYPWEVHQAYMCRYYVGGVTKASAPTPLRTLVKQAAAKLRTNIRIYDSGDLEVPMSNLVLDDHDDDVELIGNVAPTPPISESTFVQEGRDLTMNCERAHMEGTPVEIATSGTGLVRISAGNPGIMGGLKRIVDGESHVKHCGKLTFSSTFLMLDRYATEEGIQTKLLEKTIRDLDGVTTVITKIHDVVDIAGESSDVGRVAEALTGVPGHAYAEASTGTDVRNRLHGWLDPGILHNPIVDGLDHKIAQAPGGMTAISLFKRYLGVTLGQLLVIFLTLKFIVLPILGKLTGLVIGAVKRKSTPVHEQERMHGPSKTTSDTLDKVERLMVSFETVGDEPVVIGEGLRVAGRCIIAPKHVVHMAERFRIRNSTTAPGAHTFSIEITRADFDQLGQAQSELHEDLIMFRLPSLPCDSKNVFGIFPTGDTKKAFMGGSSVQIRTNDHGRSVQLEITDVRHHDSIRSHASGNVIAYKDTFEFKGVPKRPGSCGCLYVGTEHGTASVYAMHVAGSARSASLGIRLTREDIVNMERKINGETVTPTESSVDSSDFGGLFEVEGFRAVGEFEPKEASTFNPISALRPAKILPELSEHMGVDPLTYKPAALRPFDVGDERVYPMQRAISRYVGQPRVIPPPRLGRAVNTAFYPMAGLMPHQAMRYKDAVAGIPGWIKGVPRNKSNGHPKQFWSRRTALGDDDYTFGTPGELDLRRDVKSYLEALNARCRPFVAFADFPKDELLSRSKVENGDTRLISPAPTFYYVAFRMMFGHLLASVESLQSRLRNGVAIGCNPYTDWDDLYGHLAEYNSDGFAGDFKKFDASQQRQFLEVVWERMCSFYDDEWNVARRMMGLELTDSIHLASGDGKPARVAYAWNMSMPSGHPATAVVNSFYNLTLFVLCYSDLTGKSMESFWDDVRIVVLGDDNIVAPKPEIVDRFNLVTVAKAMSAYGMTYTDAEKTGVMVPTVPLEECSFLKRKFLKVQGVVHGPIAPLSMFKMCSHVRVAKKSGRSEADLQLDNLDTLMRELSLHGKEYFDAHAKPLARIFYDAYGIVPRVSTTFEVVFDTISGSCPWWMAQLRQTS